MKLFAAFILLCSLSASALPLTWRADWPDCRPVESLVHRGTDVELQPTWYINGAAAATNGWTFTTYVQTNAVGQWFGPLPGAAFSHTNDVGAAFYSVMVRAQGADGGVNYTAFARFRMLDSPGFTPGELPLPAKTIDFADVTVLNAPWPDASITNGIVTAAAATNIAEAVAASATNALDAALSSRLSRESQNSTNYTDIAIAAATNDLASASSLTNYATRAELDAGWWSEWTIVSAPEPERTRIVWGTYGGLIVGWVPQVSNIDGDWATMGSAKGDGSSTDLTWTDGVDAEMNVTAARHRVAAPVPTKPEDIGAASVADATLTPQFSEWTVEPVPLGDWSITFVAEYDLDDARVLRIGEGTTYPCFTNESAVSLTFDVGDVEYIATRTVVGYTLGDQTDKPLQAAGDYAQASLLADIAETATNALETAGAAAAASSTNSANIATLNAQVSSIGAHLNAEDAHFVSTNYDSVVNLPEAYVEIKMRDESTGSNTWITIWQEMRRWTAFVGSAFDWQTWRGFHTWATNITQELAFKAERCWGIYDSETGGYSPEGYTQISSSNILIAAGMAYQRTVTSGGAVWVLRCNQGVAQMGGDTNGFFQVFDGDGVVQFEIVKGDRREVGANADGITVDNSYSPALVTIPYSILADEHPTLRICDNLKTANWKDETDPDCLANVEWSGLSGAWVATVQRKTAGSSLFVKATYMAGGETYIRNAAPVSMDSIMLNGVKYYLGTATISGHTVLTLSTTAP
jgi:hypothetical protein